MHRTPRTVNPTGYASDRPSIALVTDARRGLAVWRVNATASILNELSFHARCVNSERCWARDDGKRLAAEGVFGWTVTLRWGPGAPQVLLRPVILRGSRSTVVVRQLREKLTALSVLHDRCA